MVLSQITEEEQCFHWNVWLSAPKLPRRIVQFVMELHSENKICENLKHWPQGWLYWTLSHAYFIHIVDLIWFQCLVFSLKLCQTFTAIYIFYVFFCRHSVYTAPPPPNLVPTPMHYVYRYDFSANVWLWPPWTYQPVLLDRMGLCHYYIILIPKRICLTTAML